MPLLYSDASFAWGCSWRRQGTTHREGNVTFSSIVQYSVLRRDSQ